jgi:translation initiation factor IF-2
MVSVIHSWVWSITEWDILMGQWSDAILVWFNVWVLSTAKWVLESSGVEFISSKIIYHITEKIEKIVTGMFDPKEIETIIWSAKVWGIFYTSKEFLVIGLILKEFLEDWVNNKIQNNALVRVIRKDKLIWSGKITSLKTGTLEVKELEWPTECWIKFVWNANIEMWDELEVYVVQKQK